MRHGLWIAFAFSAFAQTGGGKFAADLHAKYGPPLARETFSVPVGEMIVDYAMNFHVCRIQLPSIKPDNKAMDAFVLELAPLAMRGKELRSMSAQSGLSSVAVIEYENITISEAFRGQERTGITITFPNETCQENHR